MGLRQGSKVIRFFASAEMQISCNYKLWASWLVMLKSRANLTVASLFDNLGCNFWQWTRVWYLFNLCCNTSSIYLFSFWPIEVWLIVMLLQHFKHILFGLLKF